MPRRVPAATGDSVLAAWATTCRITGAFVAALPDALWAAELPGIRGRRVRALMAHLHNARVRWIRVLGEPHGIAVPTRVDQHRVHQASLQAALVPSGDGIAQVLALGLRHGGTVPATERYAWRNLPLDVGHVLAYFVAHEAHHRGQVVLAARQLGQRLPASVVNGLWHWSTRPRA